MDAQSLRDKMKEKAHRLAGGSDEVPGATTWTPCAPMNADVKTGARPISKQNLKTGGKVQGETAKHHAGRVARKSGGKVDKTGNDIINRNVKDANEDREGKKHIGGWKKGGRTGKLYGGGLYGMENEHTKNAFKNGGKTAKASGGEIAAGKGEKDQKFRNAILETAKKGGFSDMKAPNNQMYVGSRGEMGLKKGGKIKKDAGGIILNDEDIRTKPGVTGTMPAPSTPVPASRTETPVVEKVEAKVKVPANIANGSIAPSAQLGRNFSDMLRPAMDTSVDPVKSGKGKKSGGRAKRQDGGRTKGKTNINIIIAPQGGNKDAAPPPVMDAPPPMDMPPPMPMKPPIAAGPPMGMPPGPPAGLEAALNMPRKSGGKVIHMDHGAGGGLGRLEKIKKYGAKA